MVHVGLSLATARAGPAQGYVPVSLPLDAAAGPCPSLCLWDAGDAGGFGVTDLEGSVATAGSSCSPSAGGNSN